ncbi:MAG TPA: hypothetical protein VM782_09535, partial [Stellaceae bacterium]|nr:hypothetical protein [Stellaceae bacterium]
LRLHLRANWQASRHPMAKGREVCIHGFRKRRRPVTDPLAFLSLLATKPAASLFRSMPERVRMSFNRRF